MHINRRRFLTRGGAAAGVALLISPAVVRAERILTGSGRVALGLTPADRTVLAFADQIGSGAVFTGGGVLARLNSNLTAPLSIRVAVDHSEWLIRSFNMLPFREVYASGNTLQWVQKGAAYSFESLDRATYQQAEADRVSGRSIEFAHDAVSWNSVTRRISDPHQSIQGSSLRLSRLSTPTDSLGQVRQWVRGWVEAANYNLEPDSEFLQFHQQLRSSDVSSLGTAEAISTLVLSGLSSLAGPAPAVPVHSILAAPMVRECLPSLTGEPVAMGIARHLELVRTFGDQGGSTWLAALLGENRSAAASVVALSEHNFGTAFHVRTSVREARKVWAKLGAEPI